MRLKIIDLAGGDQPIVSDDGDTVIAFNGEIYNHREVREELEAWVTGSDRTATPKRCCALSCSGTPRVFRECAGCSRWRCGRNRSKRLVLARDRMGIKPLYYYRSGDDVYFGSELKAILEHPDVPRRLDLAALDRYLSVNMFRATQTLIEGIRKVPPGHLLEWRHGTTRIEAWWTGCERAAAPISLEAAKEELDWLLRESVREHWFRTFRWACGRRAGVDSSTILHYAAELTSGTAEDVFGVVSRAELRREPVLPRDRARSTEPTTTSST